jgi:hypothetical protein
VRVRDFFIFISHQLLGSWGIAALAALGMFSLFDVPHAAGLKPSMRPVYWLLTENPFYPVQILTGLYFGWFLSRRFPHKSMVWVWILPLLLLAYLFLAGPVISPWASQLIRPESLRGKFRFYFGWGCRPRERCIDQLLLTMPFYASAAYSFGALLARSMSAKTRIISDATEPSLLPSPD